MWKKSLWLSCLLALPLMGDMPEPYKSLNDLPFDGHGWFGNGDQLLSLIQNHDPKTVIEVGSWLGCSTRFIASHLSEGGIVYAVDTWRGSPEEEVHMKDPRLPYLYQLFLSNVKHAGLTDRIIPVRMNSLEAAKALNVHADLIYIDAAHDTASVYNDLITWNNHLNPGGVLCGDDWQWKTVQKAVVKAGKALNYTVYNSGNFWWFTPK